MVSWLLHVKPHYMQPTDCGLFQTTRQGLVLINMDTTNIATELRLNSVHKYESLTEGAGEILLQTLNLLTGRFEQNTRCCDLYCVHVSTLS